ncbi:MAG: hypothetical protein GC154_08215 [bacterium]|nr:hypothetical protein [bacterium]
MTKTELAPSGPGAPVPGEPDRSGLRRNGNLDIFYRGGLLLFDRDGALQLVCDAFERRRKLVDPIEDKEWEND